MSDLQALLTAFAAERLALLERHEASARIVSTYDFNNAYQYVINREETHLSWVQNALAEYGVGRPDVGASALPAPQSPPGAKKPNVATFRSILEEDAGYLAAFVERWRTRVSHLSHARHRTMLDVILGESVEHKRFFDQAASGFEDLLGRRTGGVSRVGAVLPSRWQE